MSRLPEYIDDQLDKVNFVIDSWSEPCEAPWYIYVETAKPALLCVFITLISFGWGDVLRGFLKPGDTGKRRGRKHRPRKPWLRPRFPEIGNLLGSMIPGSGEAKRANWSSASFFLWRIDDVLQAGLFWWLVADVTLDFAFDWTSLLYDTYWCRASPRGRFSYRRDNIQVLPGGQWWIVTFDEKDYQKAPPSWNVIFGSSGPKGCVAVFAIDVEKRPGQPEPLSIRTRIVKWPTLEVLASTPQQEIPPGGYAQEALKAGIPPDTRFACQAFMTGSPFCNYTRGIVAGIENQ